MKKVLILNGYNATLEDMAIRNVLEHFGYVVTMVHIGRPQDYIDIFSEKESYDFDYLIIGCHGDNGKIMVPILGESVYYPDECRGNLGFEELYGKVMIKNKIIISTGCTTGSGELYKVFTDNNNAFIAPIDYIEGNSDLMFVMQLFYHLSNGKSLEDSVALARQTDDETGLYKLYPPCS